MWCYVKEDNLFTCGTSRFLLFFKIPFLCEGFEAIALTHKIESVLQVPVMQNMNKKISSLKASRTLCGIFLP